jgi:hypothetical protein
VTTPLIGVLALLAEFTYLAERPNFTRQSMNSILVHSSPAKKILKSIKKSKQGMTAEAEIQTQITTENEYAFISFCKLIDSL